MTRTTTYCAIIAKNAADDRILSAIQNRLVLDVTLREEHLLEAEVTDYPVESGGSFSDNIRPKPDVVVLEGIISNSPLLPMANLPERTKFKNDDGTYAMTVAAEYFLRKIHRDRDVVSLITSIGGYGDMAMTQLQIDVTKEVGDGLKFTARFQQINTVTNARTEVKRTATRDGAGGKTKLGGKPATTARTIDVIWRKGAVSRRIHGSFGGVFDKDSGGVKVWDYKGGSPIIKDVEYVQWISNELAAERGLQASPVNNGAWYHLAASWDEKPKPLTKEEYGRFILDMQRDKAGGATWTVREWTEADNPDKRTKWRFLDPGDKNLRATLNSVEGQ